MILFPNYHLGVISTGQHNFDNLSTNSDEHKYWYGFVPANGMAQVTDLFEEGTRIYGEFIVANTDRITFLICSDADYVKLEASPYADIQRYEYLEEVEEGSFDFVVPSRGYWHMVLINLDSEAVWVDWDSWISLQPSTSPDGISQLYVLLFVITIGALLFLIIPIILIKVRKGNNNELLMDGLELTRSEWQKIIDSIHRILSEEHDSIWSVDLKKALEPMIEHIIVIKYPQYEEILGLLVTRKLLAETEENCYVLSPEFEEKKKQFLAQLKNEKD